jgi:trans-2,3-dihydro-3-hydroxyanthranilate isomerase
MKLRYYIVDVFTDRVFGGNPLAVVFDGERLDDGRMQRIAAEFNLSETVFVLPPAGPAARHRLRIFTPRAELPFAGHPTVGAAFLLASLGECDLGAAEPQMLLEEGIGEVAVRVFHREGRVLSTQLSVPQLPAALPVRVTPAELAAMLSLDVADLHPAIPPQDQACGVPFLHVPLAGMAAVERARLRLDRWERHLQHEPASSLYLFAFEARMPDAQLHARMFAPGLGVAEDPATGAAAAALAGMLATAFPAHDGRWLIEQGLEIGRPSRIGLDYRRGPEGLRTVRVGGPSVRVAEGSIDI